MFKLCLWIFLIISQIQLVHAQFQHTVKIHELGTEQVLKVQGVDENSGLGFSVSAIGDFNNDGLDDVAIGAPTNDFGRAYVVYGGAFQPDNPLSVTQFTGGNGFVLKGNPATGYSVSSAGDFNGDGIEDLLIVAGYTIDADMDNAIAYVLFGTSAPMLQLVNLNQMSPTEGIKFNRPILDVSSTFIVSNAGDFNGDQFDDILVSAEASQDNYKGHVYLIFGSQTPSHPMLLSEINGSNGVKFIGEANVDDAGRGLGGQLDFNNDGFHDILIGAPNADDQFNTRTGRTYVVFGNNNSQAATFSLSDINGNNGIILNGLSANGRAGRSASTLGDFNGDSIDDLIIGGPATGSTGWAFVIYGKINPPPIIEMFPLFPEDGFRIHSFSGYNRFGYAVSYAGDFNGDGLSDAIIGAWSEDVDLTNEPGTAYVLYGNDTTFKSSFEADEQD